MNAHRSQPPASLVRGSRILAAAALLCVLLPSNAAAQPLAIGNYQKVSETRITRTVTEYTYRATLTNSGPDVPGATATASSLSSATTVVDATLTFGAISSNGEAASADTFTFRQDRTVPFDWAVLQWTVTPGSGNQPPVADAGQDQTVPVATEVQLDGSNSSDADGNTLTFAWAFESLPQGSSAALTNPTTVNPTFVPDLPGAYIVRLIVNDGSIDSAPDAVVISTQNSAPVADAGPDQTALVTQLVTLDGSGSSDVDGDSLTFSWSFVSRPVVSLATLSNPSAIQPTFVMDVSGDYVVQLVVHDGTTESAPDTVTISTDNSPPTADAGTDQSVAVGETVALNGQGSSDVNGDALSFSWSFTTLPSGSTAVLSDAASATPSFVADNAGTYVVQLIVNDGTENSVPDTVMIAAERRDVTLQATDGDAFEAGPDPGVFTFTRTGSTADPLTVFYTVSGTATNGVDYQTLSGMATIPAGSTTTTITVVPIDDAEHEGPERATVRLSPSSTYSLSALDQASVNIEDDELPAVTLVASDRDAFEAGLDTGTYLVRRTGPTTAPLTVFFSFVGTATSGVDYIALPASVTIPAGSETAEVVLTPIDDSVFEGTEGVILAIAAHADYVRAFPSVADVRIFDNDGPVITITATDPDASEAGDTGTFTLARTSVNLAQDVLVFVSRSGTAINGADYASLGGSTFLVVIPANQLSVDVTITPLPDAFTEGDETVTLTISPNASYVVGTPASATVTIIGP